MRRHRLAAFTAALVAVVVVAGPVSATTDNFSQSTVDATHPLAIFIHTASDASLGAKVTWQGAACCSNGHLNSLTLSIILVDQPTNAYQEIDNNGESCSVGGGKPIFCYVLADPFTKGGIAPSGWYLVKVEEFDAAATEFNAKLSVYGDIDQTEPGPDPLYP